MRTSIAVETTPTQAAAPDQTRSWLAIQNNSDVEMAIDITSDGGSALTMSNGLILRAGETIHIAGAAANNQVMLIHGSTGTKDARIQGGV
jgi:hypothetical protein